MHYEYTYRNTTGEYWRFYMSNIYHQWTAVVNVVFTAAALVLIAVRFSGAQPVLQALMLLMASAFPVIQPIAIWLQAGKQAKAIQVDTTLTMDDSGFGIRVKNHRQLILWRDFTGVRRRFDLTVLLPDENHAYLLPDRVTGAEREQMLRDVREAMEKHRKA
ncbi:MAG: hypothetical protein K5696_06925 [Lachnospiraceae bacterium]|nr:hypothetical protein [Lachnospiraceae bacterium]